MSSVQFHSDWLEREERLFKKCPPVQKIGTMNLDKWLGPEK